MQGGVQAAELDEGADGRVNGRDLQLQASPPSPQLQTRQDVNHEQTFAWWGGQTARQPQVTCRAAQLRIARDGAKFAHACLDGSNLKD